jgi:PAS domain S-box-containing protein
MIDKNCASNFILGNKRSLESMIKGDETLEKLLTIEKAVNEMMSLRQGIHELKESETKRQEALDELLANEHRYRILCENLPQQVFMKDKDSVYTFCNQRFAAEWKRKPEEIIGRSDGDFYPKEVAEKHRLDDKRIMTTGHLEETEESFVQEGQSFVVRRVKIPLKDEKGEIYGILGVSWDITGQRNKEEELKKECERLEGSVADLRAELQWKSKMLEGEMAERKRMEERLQGAEGLRRIFEKMVTPVILMEENKVIAMANAEFEKLSGYSREEVEGKKCLTDFFSQKDGERIAEYFTTQGVNPDGVLQDTGYQLLGKNGEVREVSLSLSTIPETKKSIVYVMDLTETMRTQERNAELKEINESLIQNANEGIALVQGGVLRFANPKIFGILGYTKEELTSKPFAEFILPDDRKSFGIQPGKQRNGDFNHTTSLRMVHKDGGIRWLENREILIHWGKDKAVLHFLTDKTHQKLAEEELRISFEPFRRLVDTLEKYLLVSDGNGQELRRVELR